MSAVVLAGALLLLDVVGDTNKFRVAGSNLHLCEGEQDERVGEDVAVAGVHGRNPAL